MVDFLSANAGDPLWRQVDGPLRENVDDPLRAKADDFPLKKADEPENLYSELRCSPLSLLLAATLWESRGWT